MDSLTHLTAEANEIRKREGWMELAKAGLRYTTTIKGQFRRAVTVEYGGVSVTFDTTTAAATEWFYPRYYDGSLHEPALTRRLLQKLEPDSTFYDVGAHVGYFTVFGAAICVNGEVHAFEIDPTFVDAIRRSLNRNDFDAEITQGAVSTECGTDLSYTSGSGSSTKVSESEDRSTVESISLDEYTRVHSPPDVMKVDVEGYEYNVLKGAEDLLANGHPEVLFLEVHPENLREFGSSPNDITALLNRHDYNWMNFDHRTDSSEVKRQPMAEISENTMYIVESETND